MSENMIDYQSELKTITVRSRILDTSDVGGLKCVWSGSITNRRTTASLTWEFDWNELRDAGVDELTGHILLKMSDGFNEPKDFNIDVHLTEPNQVITKVSEINNWQESCEASIVYHFKPLNISLQKFEKMFEKTEKTDGVLLVEEKPVHVNKAFLSYHSDFFNGLFNTQLMEGQMEEIPVKDITYLEFGRLLGCVYPDTEFPSDKTCIKLAEHGHRFLMKSVLNHVEHHLLHNSELENDLKIALADAYGMEKLMGQMILELDDLEKAKKLKESPDYSGLSDKTKGKILDKLMQII